MILDGNKLASWQRGRRRYAIELSWRYRRWHPQSLFSRVMRDAIVSLSNGCEIETVSNNAVNQFLARVKQPGLDTNDGVNTYTLARDYCATMRTVLEYLSRLTLLTLRSMGTTAITEDLAWSFLSYADESGVLAAIANEFAKHDVSIQAVRQDGEGDLARLMIRTHIAPDRRLQATVEALKNMSAVRNVIGVMRVEGIGA